MSEKVSKEKITKTAFNVGMFIGTICKYKMATDHDFDSPETVEKIIQKIHQSQEFLEEIKGFCDGIDDLSLNWLINDTEENEENFKYQESCREIQKILPDIRKAVTQKKDTPACNNAYLN